MPQFFLSRMTPKHDFSVIHFSVMTLIQADLTLSSYRLSKKSALFQSVLTRSELAEPRRKKRNQEKSASDLLRRKA
jgi:hypothetical protein